MIIQTFEVGSKFSLMKQRQLRGIICSGHTGGHIMPAIAINEKLRGYGIETYFVTNESNLAEEIIKHYNIKNFSFLKMGRAKSIYAKYVNLLLFSPLLLGQINSLFQMLKPDFVVATGSLTTFPILLYCLIRNIIADKKVPFFLLEQNVLPGRVNRLFSFFSKKVFCSLGDKKDISRYLGKRGIHCGTPLREELKIIDKEEAQEFFGLDKGSPTIMILGGSQGAKFLNTNIVESIIRFAKIHRSKNFNLQVIHITGSNGHHLLIEERYRNNDIKSKVLQFLHEINYAYSASDLIICRAGGSTLYEILRFQKPAILIPFKKALDDHQTINARYLVNKGCAFMLDEKNFNEAFFFSCLEKILFCDKNILVRIRENIRKIYIENASELIAKWILEN